LCIVPQVVSHTSSDITPPADDQTSKAAKVQDTMDRHRNFLKRSDTGKQSWRPKKRHRGSVVKVLKMLDNQVQ
jgi:hypothetical protein